MYIHICIQTYYHPLRPLRLILLSELIFFFNINNKLTSKLEEQNNSVFIIIIQDFVRNIERGKKIGQIHICLRYRITIRVRW
jgi:hypothetical protein